MSLVLKSVDFKVDTKSSLFLQLSNSTFALVGSVPIICLSFDIVSYNAGL